MELNQVTVLDEIPRTKSEDSESSSEDDDWGDFDAAPDIHSALDRTNNTVFDATITQTLRKDSKLSDSDHETEVLKKDYILSDSVYAKEELVKNHENEVSQQLNQKNVSMNSSHKDIAWDDVDNIKNVYIQNAVQVFNSFCHFSGECANLYSVELPFNNDFSIFSNPISDLSNTYELCEWGRIIIIDSIQPLSDSGPVNDEEMDEFPCLLRKINDHRSHLNGGNEIEVDFPEEEIYSNRERRPTSVSDSMLGKLESNSTIQKKEHATLQTAISDTTGLPSPEIESKVQPPQARAVELLKSAATRARYALFPVSAPASNDATPFTFNTKEWDWGSLIGEKTQDNAGDRKVEADLLQSALASVGLSTILPSTRTTLGEIDEALPAPPKNDNPNLSIQVEQSSLWSVDALQILNEVPDLTFMLNDHIQVISPQSALLDVE